MSNADAALAYVGVVFYSILVPPTVFITIRHGIRGGALIGWGYLFAFCSLRVVGSAVQLSDPSNTAAATVSSIGISPSTLALGGILYEARYYRFPERRGARSIILAVIFHLIVASALGIIATGASGLASHTDPSKIQSDWTLCGTGVIMLLILIVWTFVRAFWSYISHAPVCSKQQVDAKGLCLTVALASPFFAIRVLASLVYFFSQNPILGPVGGSVGFRVGMYLIPEILGSVVLILGGWKARYIAKESSEAVELR